MRTSAVAAASEEERLFVAEAARAVAAVVAAAAAAAACFGPERRGRAAAAAAAAALSAATSSPSPSPSSFCAAPAAAIVAALIPVSRCACCTDSLSSLAFLSASAAARESSPIRATILCSKAFVSFSLGLARLSLTTMCHRLLSCSGDSAASAAAAATGLQWSRRSADLRARNQNSGDAKNQSSVPSVLTALSISKAQSVTVERLIGTSTYIYIYIYI